MCPWPAQAMGTVDDLSDCNCFLNGWTLEETARCFSALIVVMLPGPRVHLQLNSQDIWPLDLLLLNVLHILGVGEGEPRKRRGIQMSCTFSDHFWLQPSSEEAMTDLSETLIADYFFPSALHAHASSSRLRFHQHCLCLQMCMFHHAIN